MPVKRSNLLSIAKKLFAMPLKMSGRCEINMTSNVQRNTHAQKDNILSGVKNTIAVASGKACRKSHVAVNLAVALAMDGAKVGLVDADVYGPVSAYVWYQRTPKYWRISSSPWIGTNVKIMSIGFLVEILWKRLFGVDNGKAVA